ncbi:MAG TPA: hypothetical protein VH186_34705 [Chloroflexia bacterium]|nr:hypothetical protein [Chloroflexia bacterium]
MPFKLPCRFRTFSSLVLLSLLLIALLTACGDDKPTATPAPPPTALPAPTPALAYLAVTDFKFSDEAEKAQRDFVTSNPDFPAYASWTESNHWYVIARDNNSDRLKNKAGSDARITPVNYIAETASPSTRDAYTAYSLKLNRSAVDVKAGGAKEAARLLFGRAVNQIGLRSGLLIFCTGDDQINVIVPAALTADQVLALASLGKLELISVGDKSLADGTIVATSDSPALGDLKPANPTTYTTLADNSEIARVQANVSTVQLPALNLELRSGNKVFDYSRANIGKYTALVFDRQVLSSAQIAAAIKDRAQIQVPRWAGASGQADMQRFIDLINANPQQLFEAKEVNKTPNFVFVGSFTH